ncbi:MAG: hypothetical protein ACXWC4_16630 [Telluria sp.]
MHIRSKLRCACALLMFCSAIAQAAAPAANKEREAVIDQALARIKDDYVHPDKFDAIEKNVRKHQASGDYAAATDEKEFAKLLTTHLQEITNDKHMSLRYQAYARARRPAAFQSTPPSAMRSAARTTACTSLRSCPAT